MIQINQKNRFKHLYNLPEQQEIRNSIKKRQHEEQVLKRKIENKGSFFSELFLNIVSRHIIYVWIHPLLQKL